jgi:hypothetical protein
VPVTVDAATGLAVLPSASRLSLSGDTPNPFQTRTEIRFGLPAAGAHSLVVYDVAGRHIRTLSQGVSEAGARAVVWDRRNEQGHPVPAGVYFYMLRAAQGELRERVVVVR